MNLSKTSAAIRMLSLTAGALFSSALLAQTPSYFPLQVGNSWLYRLSDARSTAPDRYRSISVEGEETIGGIPYFQVRYFGQFVLLRDDPSTGNLTVFDRQSGSEQPWLSLQLENGASFPSHLDSCTKTGRIESRTAEVTTPAGSFHEAVQVSFQGDCRDAGPTGATYAPNVGPVVYEETSFAGPRRYELVYYRAGSLSASGQEVSFTIALDAPEYEIGSTLGARLTLRSTSPNPICLTFPSGQSFDLKIFNEKGDIGYTWSADKLFPMIFRKQKFGPGEQTYGVTAPLTGLPPGRYKAQGYLTTDPITYVGEVGFRIVGPEPADPK